MGKRHLMKDSCIQCAQLEEKYRFKTCRTMSTSKTGAPKTSKTKCHLCGKKKHDFTDNFGNNIGSGTELSEGILLQISRSP